MSLAARLIPLLDLTGLADQEDAASIQHLAGKAVTPYGSVAALCTWPHLLAALPASLAEAGIARCSVVDFPEGSGDAGRIRRETAMALDQGATEIDLVLPWQAFLSGDPARAAAAVATCRAVCGDAIVLKVILETAGFAGQPEALRAAAGMVVAEGADFLKTSTGKGPGGASLDAVTLLLEEIALARAAGHRLGLKVSGGVRSPLQAKAFLDQYETCFGPASATPQGFRIGASQLLDALQADVA